MGFLRFDSELMQEISRAADYVILNVLCVLCCIPVITVGAAVTAKYYVSMKMVRGEEPAVLKSYFKSFRDNFKQSTLLWILSLGITAFLALDWYMILKQEATSVNNAFRIALLILSILVLLSTCCVFPIVARFHVTMKEAIRSAVLFSFIHPVKMVLVALSVGLPYYIGAYYMEWFIAIWVICTGVCLYLISAMYVKEFAKLEAGKNAREEATGDDKETDDETAQTEGEEELQDPHEPAQEDREDGKEETSEEN